MAKATNADLEQIVLNHQATIAKLEKNLATAKAAATANERRYRDEAEAGRQAGCEIEVLLREIGDEKAKNAAFETEIKLLREMLDRHMSIVMDGDRDGVKISFAK